MLLIEESENLVMMQQGNGGLAKKGSASVSGKKKASTASRGTRKYAMMSKEKANILGSALNRRKKKTAVASTPVSKAKSTKKKTTKAERDAQLRAERDARNAERFAGQLAANKAANDQIVANRTAPITTSPRTAQFVANQKANARHKKNK